MSRIMAYGCSSAAGATTEDLWCALVDSRSTANVSALNIPVFSWNRFENESVSDLLQRHLMMVWGEALAKLGKQDRERLTSEPVGLLLSTTKGSIDDFIWNQKEYQSECAKILERFCESTGLTIARSLVISNACASSHSALSVAERWLHQKEADFVVVLAVDHAGTFVQKGFLSLCALSPRGAEPFSKSRDGLTLGDAAACILLGQNGLSVDEDQADSRNFYIQGTGLCAEGGAVTRPSLSGSALENACREALGDCRAPDVVVAHGTGTKINDDIEDRLYARLFSATHQPFITGTKGVIGHSLGASGALDVIVACEMIRHKKIIPLAPTQKTDETFSSRYVRSLMDDDALESVLCVSSGFGGVHAAALVAHRPSVNRVFKSRTIEVRSFFLQHSVQRDASVPPWAALVDRWYQLDDASFALADACWSWREQERPAAVILSSPQGCFQTDRRFVETGATSPAVFVHTLPSVRAAAACSVLNWSGMMLCVQNTHLNSPAVSREAELILRDRGGPVWVLSVEQALSGEVNVSLQVDFAYQART